MSSLLTRIPAGYGLAIASWTVTGVAHPVSTTWGYTDDGVTTATAIASGQDTRWRVPFVAANVPTFMIYKGIVTYVHRGGVILRGDAPQLITGSMAVTSGPIGLAMIAKKRTTTVGRRFRGRMYLPGSLLNRNAIDQSGTIASADLAAWQTRMTNWLTAELATAFKPVLLHNPALAIAPTQLSAIVMASVMGVQRLRQE